MEEARLAVECGADALGLVSAMPSGPGVISETRIIEIAAAVPPPIATFLLTCAQDAPRIIAQQRRTGANTLQLCDRLERGEYQELREALPGIKIVQVIHVTGPESLEEARQVAPRVDALLLDSGNQNLPVKELGGTGRVHDWSVSRAIRHTVPVPVFLAGGLRPENVAEAIRTVRPFGLDLCTGVRSGDALDPSRLRSFIQAARAAAGGKLLRQDQQD